MNTVQQRRNFMRKALALTAAATAFPDRQQAVLAKSPNEKLNIGCIGVAAQGEYNLNHVASENIVAVCDIDSQRLGKAAERFSAAATYVDYRRLLDRNDLDAVVVATPDHSHAIPVIIALRSGLDVYCEKPLGHTVYEVRQMRKWAARQNAVTQMGTQIHAGDNYRRVVEAIQAKVIGTVRRVHVWMTNTVEPGILVESAAPPAHVDYDLWLGPAPARPFHASHFHFKWRSWWDFGGGTLADFGCHYMDLPFWALGLRYPSSVEAIGEKTYEGDNLPPDSMRVDYQFPGRGDQAGVHLTWYHGGRVPDWLGRFKKRSGVLFEGSDGRLLADYGSKQVMMGNEDAVVTFPTPSIPQSAGHHLEWIQACKTRGTTTCNFDYSGALTESVLLGNVSYRAGQRHLIWDADKLNVVNCPQANQLLHKPYRAGWSLPG